MAEQATGKINGIDTDGLRQVMKDVSADPPKGAVKFAVKSEWRGQCKVLTEVSGYDLGGQAINRKHTFLIDEPNELLGENAAPNPQEVLMGAFNACMIVGYATGAAMKGITLEKLEIETEGALDLRGFLGLDATVKPGYEVINYKVGHGGLAKAGVRRPRRTPCPPPGCPRRPGPDPPAAAAT